MDPRKLIFGVLDGCHHRWRAFATTDMGYWDIALPMFMGFGLPFFFIPTTGLALASVEPHEMDNAAGLMNFLRTLSGAAAVSVVNTAWENGTTATMPNWWAERPQWRGIAGPAAVGHEPGCVALALITSSPARSDAGHQSDHVHHCWWIYSGGLCDLAGTCRTRRGTGAGGH